MDLIRWRNKHRALGSTVEHPLATFRNEVENLFDRFLRDPWGTNWSGMMTPATRSVPQLDLVESDNDVTVRAELPGVRPEDVKIEVSGNVLRLAGEKSQEKEEKGQNCCYCERQFGSFTRMIQLPSTVDPDKVEATYKDGVLTIRLSKHPGVKPKRIPVRNA